ncbi:hypothetical protein [Flavobacterium sp. YJ01]|uniref:hypothetical protein n=1 Tax=unclassified Flavobacterium TaxID=196869 RepID=UPI0023E366B1|nr:hypothetical protein [Flavobacterium sp. YJ01]WET02972.1 hypothetical protein P0R33_01315 [Flavobacterium sp. YJ01]
MEITKQNNIYTGNYLTSFMGILLMLFFVFVCSFFVKNLLDGHAVAGLIGFPVFFVLFLIFTFSMNYFILTESKIICKNPFWFWKETEIDFNAIKSISIVQPPKTAISLEIKMENATKLIPASSLRNHTWKELKKHLLKENIVVYDKVGF